MNEENNNNQENAEKNKELNSNKTINKKEKLIKLAKSKIGICTLTGIVCLTLGVGIAPSYEDEAIKLEKEKTELSNKLNEYEKNTKDLESKVVNLQKKVDEAKPWFEMTEEQKKQEQAKLAEEKAKQEAERKAKEEQERAAKEAEEKKGYDTGITYDQLARTPDDFKGKKVKFSGKVLQVMEGSGETQLRIAVNGDYNKIIYVAYLSSKVNQRILEKDQITVMGVSTGLLSYEATSGATITIPAMIADKIER